MFFFLSVAPAGPSLSASWQLGQSQVALPVYRLDDRGEGLAAEGSAAARAVAKLKGELMAAAECAAAAAPDMGSPMTAAAAAA